MFWGVGALIVLVLLAVHGAIQVLLLTFTGVLFGSALRGAGEWLSGRMRWGVRASLLICLLVIGGAIGGAALWIEPRLAAQLPALWEKLIQGLHDLRTFLSTSDVGQQLLDQAASATTWVAGHLSVATRVVLGVGSVLGATAYVLFVALYYAFSPEIYRRGLLALVPVRRRARAGEILATLGSTLQRWVWARVLSMTVLGLASTLALWLLDVPLALSLGALAGTLLFVPYLGAIASAVPALLVAATVGPWHILYVAIVYVTIHAIDGYVLDPLLQKRAIRTPPIVVLTAQLVFGALWGIVGFTIATPLVGACVIAVRLIYTEDILHAAVPTTDDEDPG